MYDFEKTEKEILSFWGEQKIFERSLALRQAPSTRFRTGQGKKNFVFFEGPPTANGRPGIHHVLARAFKDLYGRYKTMRGFYVLRKAGWDTHGLPVELEIEKELGFKNKKDIEKYGIAEFNKKAKESVWKYKTEWEELTERMGYWLDMDNPYITYESEYIESLWAIIKKIWDKKLLYLAHRVVHFCTRCGTALSSHEVAQGYRRITDKSVFVKFKVKSLKLKVGKEKFSTFHFPLSTYILAWTTTPWTLPGNVALAVGKNIEYSLVKYDDEQYILATDRVDYVFKSEIRNPKSETNSKFKIQNSKFKGSDLLGLEYEPLFDVKELKSGKSYKIYDADFVSTEEGTGVVHTAVMYGEDDYNLGTKIGLPKFHTVDEQGKFTDAVPELAGMHVKDKATEDKIIQILNSKFQILNSFNYEHDYPFCWRCGTPLLYYAKESWFIKMSAVNKQLLKNNQKINWSPEHIKEGRFGQWLRESKDWAFSRERYWGTPLPVWVCGKTQTGISNSKFLISKQNGCGNYFVAGSLEDLEKYRYKPKNTFYILRHGHSEKNGIGEQEIISSKIESDKYHLTEEGKEQVRKAAKQLKKSGRIDLIFSSPFIRTQETAKIIAEELDLKVQTEPRLGEIQHGSICEGATHDFCVTNHMKTQGWDTKVVDGESWKDVRKRMSEFLRELDSKYENKTILVVSHGDPLWLLETSVLGLGPEETMASRDDIFPSQGELKKIDLKNWPYDDNGELDLHRPYIDRIVLKCGKCARLPDGQGGKMAKIPDLIDVWFDSGAMPYAQWHWPFQRKKEKGKRKNGFENQFPADFIVEAVDQTRGWFYTLLAISTLLGKGAPYKNVISLAHVLDENGQKMSKSKGNVVLPSEIMDKFGADAVRWYFYTVNSPGDYKLFSIKDLEFRLKGFMTTLDNCVRFWELYTVRNVGDVGDVGNEQFHQAADLLDKWILSKLNRLINDVTDSLDKYDPTSAARAIEKFTIEDLSNWWLRRSRKRKEALRLLRFVLLELDKIIAPFIPFIAEDIHHRLQGNQKLPITSSTSSESRAKSRDNYQLPVSVHLHDWPKVNKKLIDKKLEEEMNKVREIVTAGLALRKEKQIKVRQPLAKLMLRNFQFPISNFQLLELIKEELNVKEVVFDKESAPMPEEVGVPTGASGKEDVALDTELTQPLIYEGYARELMRQIQDMRKEAKYRLDDKVFGQWHSDDKDVSEAILRWSDEIKKEVLLSEFQNSPHDGKAYDIEKEFSAGGGPASGGETRKIWVGIKKLTYYTGQTIIVG